MSWPWLSPVALVLLACGGTNGPNPHDPVLKATDGAVMAYDEARHQTILFGGMTDDGLSRETWGWNGTEWSRLATSGPAGRIDAGMVYDAARQRLVLYGGRTNPQQGATVYSDTWEWNGTAWTQVATSGPGARIHFALGYDRANPVTVLFGGVNGSGTDLPDVWLWNGQQWTHVTPAPAANNFAPFFAYDEGPDSLRLLSLSSSDFHFLTDSWNGTGFASLSTTGPALVPSGVVTRGAAGGLLAFGGYNGSTFVSQTWSWNGTSWSLQPGTGPSARSGAAISYDRDRDRVVLFGGSTPATVRLMDTWELSGNTWSQR
jgi:hypothetical protein